MAKKWKKGEYTTIPNKQLLKGKDAQYRSVFMAVCEYADEHGICFPSIETLAHDSGCGRTTVINRLQRMTKDGALSVVYKGSTGRSNKYQIHEVTVQEVNGKTNSTVHETDCNSSGDERYTVHETDTNYIYLTKSNNKASSSQEGLPDWLDKKTWGEWETYRKERGKKLTPSTVKRQLKLLSENKKDHIEIIEKSITHGWTGLFAIDKKKKEPISTKKLDLARKAEKMIQQRKEDEERLERMRENEQLRRLEQQKKKLTQSKKV